MPSALQLLSTPLNTTGNSANSGRQCPTPCSLPQIQGTQGGAEGADGSQAVAVPTPWSSLPLPTTPSVSGSSPRFPPALKIVLPTSPVPLATSFRIEYLARSLEGSRLGLPPHPFGSRSSGKEVGGQPSLVLSGVPFQHPKGIRRLEWSCVGQHQATTLPTTQRKAWGWGRAELEPSALVS